MRANRREDAAAVFTLRPMAVLPLCQEGEVAADAEGDMKDRTKVARARISRSRQQARTLKVHSSSRPAAAAFNAQSFGLAQANRLSTRTCLPCWRAVSA